MTRREVGATTPSQCFGWISKLLKVGTQKGRETCGQLDLILPLVTAASPGCKDLSTQAPRSDCGGISLSCPIPAMIGYLPVRVVDPSRPRKSSNPFSLGPCRRPIVKANPEGSKIPSQKPPTPTRPNSPSRPIILATSRQQIHLGPSRGSVRNPTAAPAAPAAVTAVAAVAAAAAPDDQATTGAVAAPSVPAAVGAGRHQRPAVATVDVEKDALEQVTPDALGGAVGIAAAVKHDNEGAAATEKEAPVVAHGRGRDVLFGGKLDGVACC